MAIDMTAKQQEKLNSTFNNFIEEGECEAIKDNLDRASFVCCKIQRHLLL